MTNLNDPTRLAAFRGRMLETDPSDELNAICAEVSRITESPIALVSLVMERVQFFRAGLGLPEDLAISLGANRCESFCQFVVAEGRPLIVTDAQNDARVPQQLVTRYGIAAYVGAPIVVDDMIVGSLCAVDVKPRAFSAACVDRLVELARHTGALLEALARQDAATPLPTGLDDEAPDLIRRMRLQLGVLENALEIHAPDASALQRKLVALSTTTARLSPNRDTIDARLAPELESIDRARRAMAGMSPMIDELISATRLLRRRSTCTPAEGQLLASMARMERAVAEGAVLSRVLEAWARGVLGTDVTARAVSVLHEALSSAGDLLAAVREARRAAVAASGN